MDTEEFNPIFNENYDNFLEKDDCNSVNDSIFLPTQFDKVQQAEEEDNHSINSDDSLINRGFDNMRSDRKGTRHTRKDDFDYNAYIKEEMKNYDTDTMPENMRKHMIQKIRNRMSAQRSRLRQKSMQESMEKENEALKIQNANLRNEVLKLKEENSHLRNRLKSLSLNKTEITSEEEKTNSEASVYTRDKTSRSSFTLPKTPLFLALVVVCAFLMPGSAPIDNPVVKMSGIVPLVSSNLPQTSKQLKTMDRMCADFCKQQQALCDKDMDRGAALHYLRELNKFSITEAPEDRTKQIELFDKVNAQKLICFDPESPIETENVFRIIVNGRNVDKLASQNVYLGMFEKLSTE